MGGWMRWSVTDSPMRWTVCPACEGDGWGWRTDGLVVVETAGGCRACEGRGLVEPRLLECAMRVRRAAEKAGLV